MESALNSLSINEVNGNIVLPRGATGHFQVDLTTNGELDPEVDRAVFAIASASTSRRSTTYTTVHRKDYPIVRTETGYSVVVDIANEDKSSFSREVVDAALPTLKYLPIVAYLYDGEDGKKHIAGHEHRMVITLNGFEEKSLCSAYGVIPDMEFGYEDVEEADGSTVTYLVTHAILWTGRYPEVANCAYSDKLAFHASMEIKGIEGSPDPDYPNVMRVDRFRFSALCLLGASDDPKYDYKPCFPTAGLCSLECYILH